MPFSFLYIEIHAANNWCFTKVFMDVVEGQDAHDFDSGSSATWLADSQASLNVGRVRRVTSIDVLAISSRPSQVLELEALNSMFNTEMLSSSRWDNSSLDTQVAMNTIAGMPVAR